MIVYRNVERRTDPRPLLTRCLDTLCRLVEGRVASHADAVGLLIDFGEMEAALADALFPEADGVSPLADAGRRAALALGHLFRVSWREAGDERRRAARMALGCLAPLRSHPLPGTVRLRVAEGYAYYGLHPETYLAAAERFLAETRPVEAVCVGLRNIGASLSAVVGAALEAGGCRVESLTLRPHGPPFARRPVLTPRLADRLRARKDAHFLIVDEGPGLSGSSFGGTAAALTDLGVPDRRIVLFPSWPADGESFVSDAARERWRRHPKMHVSFEEAWLARGMLGNGLRDLSGGAWRRLFYPDEARCPAVQPQHERRKYLARPTPNRKVLFKFAGLGRYGADKRARAERLAEARFTPAVLGLRDGFLMQAFVAGRPLGPVDADDGLLGTAVRYLAHLRRHFAENESVRFDELVEMIRVNTAEGLGPDGRDRLGDLHRFRGLLADVPAVAIDGRMMPHEWLRTPSGFVKTDAVDHHDDHFFPGTQDIAWDLAGFAAEFELRPRVLRELAEGVGARSGDRTLARRLPFHTVAYLACRLGYVTLAAETLGSSPDGRRMAALRRRYRRHLQAAIARLG